MRRKMVVVSIFFVLILLSVSACFNIEKKSSGAEEQGFRWIREESSFIDYSICDDTIRFRYAFCFENKTEDDVSVSCLTAKFRKRELYGWLKYEKFYDGVLESGDFAITINAGQKVTVVYVFTGQYSGGLVPEKVSVPDITMILDYE